MKIIPLDQGIYSVDKQKVFTLYETGNEAQAQQIRYAVRPFLVVHNQELILLDTGLGAESAAGHDLLSLLAQQGVPPSQITKILLSHLHKDHLNGVGWLDNGHLYTHFPNAAIYLQQRELEYALTQQQSYAYNRAMLEQVSALPGLVLMNDDEGSILPGITFKVVGGHSPFHQVFWLTAATDIYFYGADDLPQANYLHPHVAYKSDYDGKKAMELRTVWEKEGKEQHWQCLLYHDMYAPILQLKEGN
ncbi:MBL fold metallo-hydrolase [Chitinophaga sp. Cy-1792]|uniref:MBL fold metallo-hydrolase n=1 Tax=Chitinophaga sp. Cy-1792 TaxID=2608339 RepID=UPI0014226EB7|nr:MBL fold metallo-hydrolase [Chitinophaga sp. Cy-1792]NIG54464.1 MBL fold metallo-hydrolase [Chitinophaga sp. Cy-1792]